MRRAYSLYILWGIENRSISLDKIEKALPPKHPEGYSMAELKSASEALGMPLEGVRFGTGDPPLDRPVIAYFKDAKEGHFAVLRPVGTTGTMVQFLDPPQ